MQNGRATLHLIVYLALLCAIPSTIILILSDFPLIFLVSCTWELYGPWECTGDLLREQVVILLFPTVPRWCPCLLMVWFHGDLLIRFCFDLVFQPSAMFRFDYRPCFFSLQNFIALSLAVLKLKSHSPHPPPLCKLWGWLCGRIFSLSTVYGPEWRLTHFHLLNWLMKASGAAVLIYLWTQISLSLR